MDKQYLASLVGELETFAAEVKSLALSDGEDAEKEEERLYNFKEAIHDLSARVYLYT